jgi:hypothetical protein
MRAHRLLSALSVLTLFPFLSTLAMAQAGDTIGAYVDQWWPEVNGHVRGSTSTTPGSNMSLRDDLGLFRENSGMTELGLSVKLPNFPRMAFSTYGGGFGRGHFIANDVVFEGTDYPAGDTLHGQLAIRAYQFVFDFSMGTPTIYQSSFQWGFEVGFQYMAHALEVQDTAGIKHTQDFEAPIPMLGIHASLRLGGLFEIYAAVHAIQTFGLTSDFDGTYLDAKVELRWWAIPTFALGVGGRYIHVVGQNDNNDLLDVEMKGIFVSLLINF